MGMVKYMCQDSILSISHVGLWIFFEENGDTLRMYDFDSSLITAFTFESQALEVPMWIDDEEVFDLPDISATYLIRSPVTQLFDIQKPSGFSGPRNKEYYSEVTCIVLPEGKLNDCSVTFSDHPDWDNYVLSLTQGLPDFWFPAIYNQVPVKSEVLPFRLRFRLD
jgi:hypothetical protein